jgi:hypothetical protein
VTHDGTFPHIGPRRLSSVREAAGADYRLVVAADCGSDGDPEVRRVQTDALFRGEGKVAAGVSGGPIADIGPFAARRPGYGGRQTSCSHTQRCVCRL